MTDDDMQFLRELINPYDNPTSVARAEMELSSDRGVQPWCLDAQLALTILFLFACLSCVRISQSHPRRFLYDIVANARNSVDVDKFDVSVTGVLRGS